MTNTDIVNEWLAFARRDLESAKYLRGMHPAPLEVICYLCAQAAEKSLKAFLLFQEQIPPRTHDLNLLCQLCLDQNNTFEELKPACIILTPFGIKTRYPMEIEMFEAHMQKAVTNAQIIFSFVLEIIQLDQESS